MTNREKYISILSKVPNTERLIEWLCTTDFFTAPASTKYHSSYEGGLCYHSLAVYDCLKDSVIADTFSEQTLIKGLSCTTFAKRIFTRWTTATPKSTDNGSECRSTPSRTISPTDTAKNPCCWRAVSLT